MNSVPLRRRRRLLLCIRYYCLLLIATLFSAQVNAQLNVTPNTTALQMAQTLAGPGITVLNANLTCPNNASGTFVSNGTNIGIGAGVLLTTGIAQTNGLNIGANGNSGLAPSNDNSAAGDPALGNNTNDACALEFDFIPIGDTVTFAYVFASEEYSLFTCTQYNDAFAFYISGPGASGNMALIPGTTVPVTINSINSGIPGPNGNIATCNQVGPGSPFTTLYVANNGNTITYDGFTVPLIAQSPVQTCDTYHLKMVIADVADGNYDSGVFLAAGSLTSSPITVKAIGGANGALNTPEPYCIRGCAPGKFEINRHKIKSDSTVIRYDLSGTAIDGTDYSYVATPGRVTIPQFDSVTYININPLLAPFPTGPRTVKIRIFQPCDTLKVLDSAILIIRDTIFSEILTPDTTICKGDTVHIRTLRDPITFFSWTPAAGLLDPLQAEPLAVPDTTTTYKFTVGIIGCPTKDKYITITIRKPPEVNVGPDTTTCLGTPYQLNATVTPTMQLYHYTWTPPNYLNNDTIANPLFTPQITGTFTYIFAADPGVSEKCIGRDTIKIRVLPNDFNLYNHDSSICKGAVVQINADGDPAFTYQWTPGHNVSDPSILTPTITPDTSGTYNITAHFAGCPDIVKHLAFDVQPVPVVWAGADRAKCQWDTLQFHGIVTPDWYKNYSYSWTPAADVAPANQANMVFSGQNDATLTLTVTTPAGCSGSDNVQVTVHQGNFAEVSPADTGVCPPATVQLHATGGVNYHWTPGLYMNDTNSADPVVTPETTTDYTGIVTDQYGCPDTVYAHVVVHPKAVLALPDSVTIGEGETVQLDPQGNGLYYHWFPPLGLSDPDIANPIAGPEVNTRYFVDVTTEWGCKLRDSIDVYVDMGTMIDVPNAFTPGNSMGPNNELHVVHKGIVTLKSFSIFNRWGTKVFETNDINQGWDGRFNGTLQPMGVYVYMVEAYSKSGKRFYKQGNTTLIR